MNGNEGGEQTNSSNEPNYQAQVLEQWKFYGQSTHQVSNRRLKNNRFYLRLLIALLGVAGIGGKLELITPVGILFIGAIGLPFCVLWVFHILSYKQLNSGKYRVLWKMAEQLPYDPFKMEWDRLKEGEKPDVYIKHTTVEVWWPRVFGLFYAILVLFGSLSILGELQYYWWGVGILSVVWIGYAALVLKGISPTQKYWDYTGE